MMIKLNDSKTQINDLFAKVRDYLSSRTQDLQSEKPIDTSKSQASNEVANKSLEFETDTFRIDSTNRKQEIRKANGHDTLVKVSPAGDVIEYLEDFKNKRGEVTCKRGEQLFIGYDNFIKYVAQAKGCSVPQAEQRYLLTREELRTKMSQIDYKEFYEQEIKGHLAGFWFVIFKRCFFVGTRSDIWLAGGDYAGFNQYLWYYFFRYASFGLSGRLLKN